MTKWTEVTIDVDSEELIFDVEYEIVEGRGYAPCADLLSYELRSEVLCLLPTKVKQVVRELEKWLSDNALTLFEDNQQEFNFED